MILNVPIHKKCNINQQIEFQNNNCITLIGENGSGKSSLLESVFKEYSFNEVFNLLVFSSGQNESYSGIFENLKEQNKKYIIKEEENIIKSFYFNSKWSYLLIFFATSIKNGLVRNYLREKELVKEISFNGEEELFDVSSKLYFQLRINKTYIDVVEQSLEKEKLLYENKSIRKTFLHYYLEKILNYNGHTRYDFDRVINKEFVEISSKNIFEIFTEKNIYKIFSFFSIFEKGSNYLIDISKSNLLFKNGIELSMLSDGEFQLLSIYALVDLFDNDDTIFLLDEIDSHLHFSNISRLWDTLKNIKGKVITTTHISESILKNNYDSLLCINDGKIENTLTATEIFKRLSNITGQKKYEYKVASKIKNIALLDDEIDWKIFRKLAIKKIGSDASQVLDKVIPYKRSSSFNTTTEIFAKGKLEFVKKFKEQNIGNTINTKNIFLICDRDLFPLSQINTLDLSVNIPNTYNDIRSFGTTKTYLHSWRMLEIENYLLSKTMLQNYGKLESLKQELSGVNFDGITTFDESEDLRTYDAKSILHPLYKNEGFNEVKLDEIVDKIPPNEISEDIVKMYEFIKTKVASN